MTEQKIHHIDLGKPPGNAHVINTKQASLIDPQTFSVHAPRLMQLANQKRVILGRVGERQDALIEQAAANFDQADGLLDKIALTGQVRESLGAGVTRLDMMAEAAIYLGNVAARRATVEKTEGLLTSKVMPRNEKSEGILAQAKQKLIEAEKKGEAAVVQEGLPLLQGLQDRIALMRAYQTRVAKAGEDETARNKALKLYHDGRKALYAGGTVAGTRRTGGEIGEQGGQRERRELLTVDMAKAAELGIAWTTSSEEVQDLLEQKGVLRIDNLVLTGDPAIAAKLLREKWYSVEGLGRAVPPRPGNVGSPDYVRAVKWTRDFFPKIFADPHTKYRLISRDGEESRGKEYRIVKEEATSIPMFAEEQTAAATAGEGKGGKGSRRSAKAGNG